MLRCARRCAEATPMRTIPVMTSSAAPSPSASTSTSPSDIPTQQPVDRRTHPRELPIEGLPNVRDLGGIPLSGGGVVQCGRVLRSASPQLLTTRGAEQLHRYGVRIVVDLRSPTEAASEGHGPMEEYYADNRVRRVSVPLLSDAQRKTDPVGTVEALDDPAAHYINYLASAEQFVTIARVVLEAAAAGGAALFHCALGKDRTGVSAAIILDAVGAEHHDVVDDYAITADHVPTIVRRLAHAPSYQRDFAVPDWSGLAPQPSGIAGMLRWLHEHFDGAGNFLLHGGLRDDELVQLRAVLRYLPASSR